LADTPDVTLIITTYNRAKLLREALESVARSRRQPAAGPEVGIEVGIEVLVVDNNSVDNTAEVVAEIRDGGFPFDLVYLKEGQQGLSFARNCGIAAARGSLLAFMDDDQLIDEAYLCRLPTLHAETGTACMGGKIAYYNADGIPAWLAPLIEDVGQIDLGEGVREMRGATPRDYLKGGNISFTRAILDQIGGFNTELGRIGDQLLGGEELEIQDRVIAAGGKVVYHSDLIQYHLLRPERRFKSYWRRHAYDWGRSEFEMEKDVYDRSNRLFGAPRTYWWYLITGDVKRYLGAALHFDAPARFQAELRVRQKLGKIAEARRQFDT